MQRPDHPAIARARKIARLLDSAITIPVIRKKIGLDPLLGMLPIGGDVVSALMACYLLWTAYELRLPAPVITRMSVNVAVDILVGLIPVVGDVADMLWKSNDMNFKILEAAYQKHGVGPKRDPQGGLVVDVVAEPA